jgi:hypothetical protein
MGIIVKVEPVWEAISKKLLGIECVPFREKERMIKRAGKAAYEAAQKETTWFLLYGGSSTDGRGEPKFEGRTTDKKKAIKFFKRDGGSPYSLDEVKVVTDKSIHTVRDISEFVNL